MPYIEQEERKHYDDEVDEIVDKITLHPGHLNYVLTRIVNGYLSKYKGVDGRTRYTHYNEVTGVLQCMIQEIYRRLVGPYEDEKINENGDCFTS